AGEPVIAIAAVDADAAQEAADLVEVDYEEIPAALDILGALESGAPLVHESTNLAYEHHVERGDIAAGFADADEIFEDEFSTPSVQHVPLEPHCCVAMFQSDRLTVWSSTQDPFGVRDELAALLGVPRSRVRVLVPSLGGGFGSKGGTLVEPIAAALAQASGRPVRLTLTRAEEFTTYVRHASRVFVKTGVKRDGRLVAREAKCYFSTGAYSSSGVVGISNGGIGIASLYRFANVRVDAYAVYTNTVPVGAFRAPGVPQVAWASETQLEMIAERLGIDAVELRRMNLIRNDDRFVAGGLLEDIHFNEMLDRASAEIGWKKPTPADAQGRRIGRAVIPTLKTTRTPTASNAALKLNQDDSVHLLTGAVEMGQGSRTALAQIAAHELGVPVDAITVATIDTDLSPYEGGTVSSRTTFTVGGSLSRAAADLHDQLSNLAADQLEVSPDDVVIEGGRAFVRGVPGRSKSFGELIAGDKRTDLLGQGRHETQGVPDPVTGLPGASAHWHHGVVAVEVAVDCETGRVDVTRMWAGVYAGRIVNPTLCELQAHGSVLMGLGEALFEGMHYESGALVTKSLAEYNIPSFRDAPPEFRTGIVEDQSKMDFHGIGETLVPAAPVAIGCAVADAIGVRPHELPLTPERLLRALYGQESAS
ncbi:MAG: molybdopterin-dependent oxidoreductase, partial [Chloroflexi bacterium]|nr:molybdopterin-dependent oxidoreductase [Chloroflexota bacterium]